MIDNVIVSSNDDPRYLQHWPMVAAGWRALGFNPVLAYVSAREDWADQSKHGTVRLVNPHPEIPDAHMAKISRMMLATILPGESLLSDVDMMPLAGMRDYLLTGRDRKPGHLALYGAEAYVDWASDRYPICYMLTDRQTWGKIVNPSQLSIDGLLESWRGRKKVDFKDDPYTAPFSDESLLTWLLRRWNKPDRLMPILRGWENGIARGRLDRACWEINRGKLKRGEYIDAHLPHEVKRDHGLKLLAESMKGLLKDC